MTPTGRGGQGEGQNAPAREARVEAIDAVTLATRDMARAVEFYRALGFKVRYGGEEASFTSLNAGASYLNLIAAPPDLSAGGARQAGRPWWGRVIFRVTDVDAFYERALAQGFAPQSPPRDAEWGERYFHITDPDGHDLSFAKLLG